MTSLDATEITPLLSQGSAPEPGSLVYNCGFDVLVLAAKEYQPPDAAFSRVRVLRAPLEDAELSPQEWREAQRAARGAIAAYRKGHRVLSTCYMGINRSGLLSALILRGAHGMTGKEAVALVQQKRRGALSNPSFVEALTGGGLNGNRD